MTRVCSDPIGRAFVIRLHAIEVGGIDAAEDET